MSATIKAKSEVNSSVVEEDLENAPTRGEKLTPRTPVVRTLKPPPEIWELVHPVPPSQYTPGRAFISRFASSRSVFILLAGVIVLVGFYQGLRSGKRIVGVRNTQVAPAMQVDTKTTGVAESSKPPLEHNDSQLGVATTVVQPTDVDGSENLRRNSTRRGGNSLGAVTHVDSDSSLIETTTPVKTGSAPQGLQVSQPSGQKVGTQSLASAAETAKEGSPDSASTNRKSKTTLSPQLIDSSKTSTPRKAKVIQWP